MNYTDLDLSILKSIISNKKNAVEFASSCDTKVFSTDFWNFANLVVSYVKAYKETPSLRVLEEQLNKGNNKSQADYCKKVWGIVSDFSYNDKEFAFDLQKIKNRYAEKQLIQYKDSLANIQDGKVDVDKQLKEMLKISKSIKSLNEAQTYESQNIKEYLPTFVEKFNLKKNDPKADRGLITGYSVLDDCTNGLKPADFMLIAGESGFGKSLFLNNIAIQVWLQSNQIFDEFGDPLKITSFAPGKNIVYFSLEMPYEDCFNRLLSRLSGVESKKIENANLTKEEFAKIKSCLDFIRKYPYSFRIVDIADACANDLDLIISEMIEADEEPSSIFIDYLGIMRANEKGEEADWLRQGVISQEVRAIARKYKKPIFSAVQLNRKSTTSKEPGDNIGLSRLARSATIATHATHVIQIENRPNEEQFPDFKYHIIKNRKGRKAAGTLIKNLACAMLLDQKMKEEKNNLFTDNDDISDEVEDLDK